MLKITGIKFYFLPVISEVIQFLLADKHEENGIVKGGIKVFNVPGLIKGTNKNMSKIENLLSQSIKSRIEF